MCAEGVRGWTVGGGKEPAKTQCKAVSMKDPSKRVRFEHLVPIDAWQTTVERFADDNGNTLDALADGWMDDDGPKDESKRSYFPQSRRIEIFVF